MTDQEKIQAATELIQSFGSCDGSHHKDWVLDQVLRVLMGEDYEQWVAEMRADGYGYEEGIAP